MSLKNNKEFQKIVDYIETLERENLELSDELDDLKKENNELFNNENDYDVEIDNLEMEVDELMHQLEDYNDIKSKMDHYCFNCDKRYTNNCNDFDCIFWKIGEGRFV